MQDAISVNLELHANARHAARCGLKLERESAEAPIIFGPLALALQYMDQHAALFIDRGSEHLARFDWNRRIARDNDIHQTTKRLQTQRERRHVEQKHISESPGENLGLDGGPEGHGFVRILGSVKLRPF